MAPRPQPASEMFAHHLRRHAAEYFGDSDCSLPRVSLLSRQQRVKSTFHEFQIDMASQSRVVLVKVPVVERLPDRPRVVPIVDPVEKIHLEYQALSSIHQFITALDQDRFGAVRVLDFLPAQRAIITEKVVHPGLKSLFVKANRLEWLGQQQNLKASFSNAGAWLRAFHSMPRGATLQRGEDREQFVDSINRLTDFLGKALHKPSMFADIAAEAGRKARQVLPQRLHCGRKHGDYAMRNILVGPDNRIVVLDTLAYWWTPVLGDIAYFLTAMKTSRPQVASQGLAFRASLLRQSETAFLQGYFAPHPVPIEAVRMFELQALLDRWAGLVHQRANNPSSQLKPSSQRKKQKLSQVIKGLRLSLVNRFFNRSLQQLLASMPQSESASAKLQEIQ